MYLGTRIMQNTSTGQHLLQSCPIVEGVRETARYLYLWYIKAMKQFYTNGQASLSLPNLSLPGKLLES